eukprot:GHVU01170552.1.p1 GENE.GHVU01170552.1~~GHVU01170552.1.p1  ORF type:complete len:117 (+),score=0.31 GHVU01170552.1:47-352(+)
MTSGDLESRSRLTICKLDLCLVVRNLHTKFEDPSFIISQDIVRKPKCDGRRDRQTDRRKRQNQYVSPLWGDIINSLKMYTKIVKNIYINMKYVIHGSKNQY